MGINLGAALGAATSSAMNTYERLGEEDLRSMQREKLKRDLQSEQDLQNYIKQSSIPQATNTAPAINQAMQVYGEDQGTANTVRDIISKQTPDQQQATLRSYGSAEGIPSSAGQPSQAVDLANFKVESKQKNQSSIYREALGLATKSGNLDAIQKLMTLKSASQKSEFEDKFSDFQSKVDDQTHQMLALTHKTAGSNNLEDIYNEATKQGMTNLQFVKQGKGGFVNVLDNNGKVVDKISDVKTAVSKIEQSLVNEREQLLQGMLSNPEAVLNYGMKKKELAIKEQEASDKGMYYRAAANAYNTGAKGGAKETIKSKAQEYADALVDSGQINPKTKSPYTAADAKAFAYDIILKNPAAKPASEWKSVPSNPDIQENGQGQQREWDPKTKSYQIRGEMNPVVAAFASQNGTQNPAAPKQAIPIQPMQVDYNPGAYTHFLDAAKNGDQMGKSILAGWLDAGELTAGQVAEAKKYIK